MNIKRFTASSAKEALQMVKKEMGPEAVILRTRNIPSPRGSDRIEVTAAIDYETPAGLASVQMGRDSVSTDRHWQYLEKEVREIKDLLLGVESNSILPPDLYFNHDLRNQYTNLKQFGLRSDIITDIMSNKVESREKEPVSQTQILKESLYRVMERISFEDRPENEKSHRIFSFVGPTGVGKTTSLAKLAALSAISRGERTAMITLDTFRIAAVAQLKTYAQIMDIPLEVVMNKKELSTALKKHHDYDSVFIDTAGRSPKMEKDIHELNRLFDVPEKIHHYLVLSATTRYEDLLWAEERFKVFPYSSYIFTKLDETIDASSMVNFLVSKGKPLSYLTTGQQVPEDIEVASKKKLATLLLSTLRGVMVDNSRDEGVEYGSSCGA
jgi:flagellar biosynthesis protein FlhF